MPSSVYRISASGNALRSSTTTTLTPKEIHQLGLEQAKALSARAETILRELHGLA